MLFGTLHYQYPVYASFVPSFSKVNVKSYGCIWRGFIGSKFIIDWPQDNTIKIIIIIIIPLSLLYKYDFHTKSLLITARILKSKD